MEDKLISQLEQIIGVDAEHTAVNARNLIVDTSEGLSAFLVECVTTAKITESYTLDQRLAYLSEIFPGLTSTLRSGAMMVPSDASGEQIALAMCAMQLFPFYTKTPETVLSLDDPLWKMMALNALQRAIPSESQTKSPPPPPAETVLVEEINVNPRNARLPLQTLASLIVMSSDIGVTVDFLFSVASKTVPKWFEGKTDTASVEGYATPLGARTMLYHKLYKTHQIMWAKWADRRAVAALIRAVIAIEHARERAATDETKRALPSIIDWDIHLAYNDSTYRSPDTICFSVHSALSAPEKAEMPLFAAALYHHLGIYLTRNIRPDEPLDLTAFLAARGPLVDGEWRRKTPGMWLRRADKTNQTPDEWFRVSENDANAPINPDQNRYSFHRVPATGHKMDVAFSINDTCRECGTKLHPVSASLWCDKHIHCARDEE